MRKIVVILSLAVLLALLAIPLQAQDGQVNMIVTRDPISFDPHGTLDPGAPVLLAYIYDTLVYQDTNGNILPSLAEGWTVSDDNLSITFTLKPGIVFSDGSPFNADAVIFTYQRLQENATRSLIFRDVSNIAEFEKVDDLTVIFTLNEPSATLLSALTYAYAGILSPSAVEVAGESYGENPVGTGPFMLDSWTPESELTMVPNPLYAGHRPWVDVNGPPSIESLRVQFSRDESARASALLAGDADLAYLASASQLGRFEGNGDFTLLDSPSRGMNYLGFNTAREPFDNVQVRQALAQAINRDEVLLIASDGLGIVANTPLPSNIFGYSEELEADAIVYDPEAAQATLAEAGFGSDNPLSVTILTSTFPTFQSIATVIQAQWAAVGVNAEVEVLDFSVVRDMAIEGDYDMLVTRWDWNDADVLRRYLGTESIPSTNRFAYSNPELDELFMLGRQEFDPEARTAIYADVQRIIQRDLPILSLYWPVTQVVYNNRLQDVGLLHSHVVLDAATLAE